MHLGASLPVQDIGTGPAVMRDYAQAAEGLGYSLSAGARSRARRQPGQPITAASGSAPRPTPITTRSCCSGFSPAAPRGSALPSGVLILAQRQAALVAKQAACLDVLCGGRFRLGIGVGWNEVEFTGLNENFHNRGKRSEEQVRVMQALWAEPHVNFTGEFHRIDDAGINPRPASGRVPIWYGGHAEATFRRAAKYGDGFMPLAYPAGDAALAAFDKLRRMTREAGRDPAEMGLEVWASPGAGDRGRLAPRDRVLEKRRRHPRHRAHDLYQRPPQADRRPHRRRAPGGDHPLPRSRGGPLVMELPGLNLIAAPGQRRADARPRPRDRAARLCRDPGVEPVQQHGAMPGAGVGDRAHSVRHRDRADLCPHGRRFRAERRLYPRDFRAGAFASASASRTRPAHVRMGVTPGKPLADIRDFVAQLQGARRRPGRCRRSSSRRCASA